MFAASVTVSVATSIVEGEQTAKGLVADISGDVQPQAGIVTDAVSLQPFAAVISKVYCPAAVILVTKPLPSTAVVVAATGLDKMT